MGNGLNTLKYPPPYIFRVAISNNRIEKLANGSDLFIRGFFHLTAH